MSEWSGTIGAMKRKVDFASMLFRRADAKRERFERQAESHMSTLMGTALRFTRNSEDAQDLVQETVIRAYEAFDRFDGRNFKAWILRIMTNLFINRYRQTSRQGAVQSLEEEHVVEPVDASEDIISKVFDGLMGDEVEQALARVPNDFRTAVLLCDVEGLSYEEIAEATNVPVGTVRSRIARGRAALRKELENYARESGFLKGMHQE